jgi:hypothetical protein
MNQQPNPSESCSRFLCAAAALVMLASGAWAQTPAQAQALKDATSTAKGIRDKTGAKPAAKELPTGDPCAIVSTADVQKVFPGVKGPERSKRLEEYGTTECAWKDASGRVVLAVQESYNDGVSSKEDVLGMAQGFADPIKGQALKNVRIEGFPSLGDAAAFVETADPKRGILGDGAFMEVRKGRHTVTIGSGELPSRDRAAALKALEDLGRVASKRL